VTEFGWPPLTVTVNGETRQVRRWAEPVVLVMAVPALAVVLVAVVICLFAVVLALPALVCAWPLSKPKSEASRTGGDG
jgi:hypothetical protein